MNYSKILNWIFGIMAFIGFFLIIGAVGASDLADELGIYEPVNAHMKHIFMGFILMVPCFIRMRKQEGGDEQ